MLELIIFFVLAYRAYSLWPEARVHACGSQYNVIRHKFTRTQTCLQSPRSWACIYFWRSKPVAHRLGGRAFH